MPVRTLNWSAEIHSGGNTSAIKSELACRLPVSPDSRPKVLQACRKDTEVSIQSNGRNLSYGTGQLKAARF